MTLTAAELLEAMVRIPSPTGEEDALVGFLQEQARADGFTVHADAAGNFIAERGSGERVLWFVGHVDTVPGDIPVRVEDGALWGRGSVDAKGCFAAAYTAARDPLPGGLRVFVIGCVDEEGTSQGARGLDLPTPDWIINGEPSGADGITLGYKGIVRGRAAFETRGAHGAHPGPNALDRAHAWWSCVQDAHRFGTGFDDVFGRLDGTDVDHDGLRQVVEIAWQLRVPPGEDIDGLAGSLRRLGHQNAGAVEVQEAWPAATTDRRSPLAVALTSAIRQAGLTPRPKRKTGTSDFNVLAQRFPDIPIIAYGPGDARLDHTPEERLVLHELEQAVIVWRHLLHALAGAA